VERGHADVVLIDIIPGLHHGKALDISQSAPVIDFNTKITAASDYQETAGSDVAIITSGLGRKPGMTRDQLLSANMKIVSEVTQNLVKYSPECIIIVVTNPVDAMTYLALKISRFPKNRVVGLSGALDSARLISFISAELDVAPKDVSAHVLGEHGKNMLVIPRLITVKGKPLSEILPEAAIEKLISRTIGGGAEIVELLKSGSAFYAPSAAAARMAEAIILDKKEVIPCAAYLEGEYGISDSVIGVPVKLGRGGIEEIVELKLNDEERKALASSAEAVKELIKEMGL
jgi:malate dehydrogenase